MPEERYWFPYRRDLGIHPKTDTFTLLTIFCILEGHFVQNGQSWMLIPPDPKKFLATLEVPAKKRTGHLYTKARHFAASGALQKFGNGSLIVKPRLHEIRMLPVGQRKQYAAGRLLFVDPDILENPFGKGAEGFIRVHSQIRPKIFKYGLRRYDIWLYLALVGQQNANGRSTATLTFQKIKKCGMAAPNRSKKMTLKMISNSVQRLEKAGLIIKVRVTAHKIVAEAIYAP